MATPSNHGHGQAEPHGHAPGHDHDHGQAHDHAESRDHGHGAGGHEHEHPGGLRGLVLSVVRPHSHDAADSVDAALESNAEGIRALKVSLLALLATAVLELLVVVFSVARLAWTTSTRDDAPASAGCWRTSRASGDGSAPGPARIVLATRRWL